MLAIPQAQASHDTGLFVRNEWRNLSLSFAQKGMLFTLATYATPEGICWPSLSMIASDCGCTQRYVCQLLGELEAKGVIRRVRRNQGQKETTVYELVNQSSLVASEIEFTRTESLLAGSPSLHSPPPISSPENSHSSSFLFASSSTSQPQTELSLIVPVRPKLKPKPKPRPQSPGRKPANAQELRDFAKAKNIPDDWAYDFWLHCNQLDWTYSQGSKILPLRDWKQHMQKYWRLGYCKPRVEVKR
jgi:DNA-binding MarR family transcriptional regulator